MAEFSIAPIGLGQTGMHEYVAEVLKVVGKSETVDSQLTPMGTILEADEIGPILDIIRKSHEALRKMGVKRISTNLKIDERSDVKGRRMAHKVSIVKQALKKR